jgi:hypothetical protein
MGEIHDVCTVSMMKHKTTNPVMKLQGALPMIDLFTNNVPTARLTVSAQVSNTQRDINSFRMVVYQNVLRTERKQCLLIHAILGYRPLWPHMRAEPPDPNDIVSFTGDFCAFADKVAVITVDDVNIIPHILTGPSTCLLNADPTHGTMYLSSRVVLEEPQALQGHHKGIVIDALIPSGMHGNPPIVASLCYNMEDENNTVEQAQVEPGTYMISAIVCCLFLTHSQRLTLHEKRQVVAFEKGCHPKSATCDDEQFTLMGDILMVKFAFYFHVCLSHFPLVVSATNACGCFPCGYASARQADHDRKGDDIRQFQARVQRGHWATHPKRHTKQSPRRSRCNGPERHAPYPVTTNALCISCCLLHREFDGSCPWYCARRSGQSVLCAPPCEVPLNKGARLSLTRSPLCNQKKKHGLLIVSLRKNVHYVSYEIVKFMFCIPRW